MYIRKSTSSKADNTQQVPRRVTEEQNQKPFPTGLQSGAAGLPVPWFPRPGKAHLVLWPKEADTARVFPPVNGAVRTDTWNFPRPRFVRKTSTLNVHRDVSFVLT